MTYLEAWRYNGLDLHEALGNNENCYRLMDKSGKVVATAIYPLDMNGIPAAVEYFGNARLAGTIHRFLYHETDIVCPYCLSESWRYQHNYCEACSCQ